MSFTRVIDLIRDDRCWPSFSSGSKELERLAKTLFSTNAAFIPFEYSMDDLTVIMAEIFFQVRIFLTDGWVLSLSKFQLKME
jgi:hypothetical protein